ncbi:hypothetical protein BDV95DRAFT_569447 [Massariosphaeria phaeospora]|uniref:Rhodopsin domain-containing protein n=1 Tax=Massariosphaeria phaeospora TaxID=100035 RepID=A0A7C8MAU6_9PLEO|nr:hypothetical protein BDV95DRAFT_569447 [Massariosphaeria phaeospora]
MAPFDAAGVKARQLDVGPANFPPGIDPYKYMLDLPALSPSSIPPGADRTMTLDGPDQVWYLVVAITCIAIPGLFLMVRVYTKFAVVRGFELADYFLFLAFPLMVVEIAFGFNMIKWGAGVHQWQVTLGQLFNQLYWMNTAEVAYCPLSFLVKMSILLQYIRLFAPTRDLNKPMWYGAWATAVACFIFYTIFMFWTLFYCYPRQMIWNKLTPNGKCNDHTPIVISQGAFNMGSDIIILLLPTTSLWQLHVPFARKMVITVLFATGLLACAASVMRIVFTIKIAPVISMADVSHNGLFIGLWTQAEVALGFIVSCALCLPRLIQAKKSKLSRARSYLSSPLSSLRDTVSRTPPRSTTRSSSRKSNLRSQSQPGNLAPATDAMHMSKTEGKRPMFYDETIIERPPHRMRPITEEHDDFLAVPSQGSSDYSHSIYSKGTSDDGTADDDSLHVAPLNVRNSAASEQLQYWRSISTRTVPEHETLEERDEDRYVLQQFDFESAFEEDVESASEVRKAASI